MKLTRYTVVYRSVRNCFAARNRVVSTPVHRTDVAHSGNDGAAEIDGTDVGPNDRADVGFVDGVDDGEDERAEERRPHP